MTDRWRPTDCPELADPARLSTPIPVATEEDWLADEAHALRRHLARLERENRRLRRERIGLAAAVCGALAVAVLAVGWRVGL